MAEYFAPYNQAALDADDWDLGSGGPLLLPDSVGSVAYPHLIVGCGKAGTIYLLDRDNLGQYNSTNDNQIDKLKLVIGLFCGWTLSWRSSTAEPTRPTRSVPPRGPAS